MDPFENDERKGRKNPFDFFGIDDEFERMFREMEEMMDQMMRGRDLGVKPGSSFVHGFSAHIGPDGKPHIEQFGNRPVRSPDGEATISEEREPLTDLIEGENDVSVTVELPGVEKKDIDVSVTDRNLQIKVDAGRRYYKQVDLPCDVLPKSTKATYKNGILDILIQRKHKKSDEGHQVTVE